MKAIMLSIQPKYSELIAQGKKTIEVRKTRPKLQVPFKCYIYCTGGKGKEIIKNIAYRWNGTRLIKRRVDRGCLKDKPEQTWQILLDYGFTHPIHNGDCELNGKVIGEFICDKIERYPWEYWGDVPGSDVDYFYVGDEELEQMCLSEEELNTYGNGKTLYGLHITDLKIYDKPKELGEFFTACHRLDYDQCGDCPHLRVELCGGDIDAWCGVGNSKPLTRPPQSWAYVEEM